MAKTTYKTWADNTIPTAAEFNEQIRDNGNAIWVGTTAGDMDYYNSATTKARLAIGAEGTVLQSNGTTPFWADAETASVYYNGAQSIGNNSLTAIASFNTEYFDTDGFHTGTDGNITIPATFGGYYFIWAGGYFSSHATANKLRHMELLVGATVVAQQDVTSVASEIMGLYVSTLYSLSAGDVITVKVKHTAGVSLNFNYPELIVVRLK